MANLRSAYDPNAEAQQDIGPLPTGEYTAVIVDSDMKPTSNNNGHYLELVYQVTDGECAGRKVWVRLNLDNPNPKTVEIANRQFAAIREATGVINPDDSVQLHNKPHVIRVEFIPSGTVKGNKTYDRDSNEVRAWKRLDGATPIGTPATAQPAAKTPPPWGQRGAA